MSSSDTDGKRNVGTYFHGVIRRMSRVPLTSWLGIVVIAMYVLVALFAPLIAPYGEFEVVSQRPFEPWSEQFIFGTDQLGRDVLSRLIFGARNTIGIAFVATSLTFLIGGTVGITAAVVGGVVDQAISRVVDAVMSIPDLVFILMLLAIAGPGATNLVIIIAVIGATRVYRLSRAAAHNVVSLEFVEAARARGETLPWVVTQEIQPNILPVLISDFGMRFCFVFLAIAGLSFLGVGLQPPTAEWGSMVRESAALISAGDITPLIPATAIGLLTIAVNFVGDWILNETSGLSDGR